MSMFRQATRKKRFLRMCLFGPSGSGKTYTSLKLASLLGANSVAVIDSENSSSEIYEDFFNFQVCNLHELNIPEQEIFSPETYAQAVDSAANNFQYLIIDSFSHSWQYCLEEVERIAKKNAARYGGTPNTFTAWKDMNPRYERFIQKVLNFPGHVIVTMRAKEEYVMEANERGKQVPKKVGMGPEARKGTNYEFDIVGELTQSNELIITKSRCFELQNQIFNKPGEDVAAILKKFLAAGVDESEELRVKTIRRLMQVKSEYESLGGSAEEQDFEAMNQDQLVEVGKSLKAKLDKLKAVAV